MSNIPHDIKYTQSHEWVRLGPDGVATMGITDHAQASLGDITFVQLPRPGANLEAGAHLGVVESVKAASDLYTPLAGEVLAVNAALEATPELANQSPYGDGWMLKLKLSDPASIATLLDAPAYAALLA